MSSVATFHNQHASGTTFFLLLFRFCNGDVVLLAVALVRAHSL